MKTKTKTLTTDKEVLIGVGFPLAQEFYENCCGREGDVMMREKLWDATMDGLLSAIRSFNPDYGATFEAFLYYCCVGRWRRVKYEYYQRPHPQHSPLPTFDDETEDRLRYDHTSDVDRQDSVDRFLSFVHPHRSGLNAWQHECLIRRFGIGRDKDKLKTIAADHGVTNEAVRKCAEKALTILRGSLQWSA